MLAYIEATVLGSLCMCVCIFEWVLVVNNVSNGFPCYESSLTNRASGRCISLVVSLMSKM